MNAQELILLALKEKGEQYGLGIQKTIKSLEPDEKVPSISTLYQVLRRLERQGLIKSYWGEHFKVCGNPRRRYYRLVDKDEQ